MDRLKGEFKGNEGTDMLCCMVAMRMHNSIYPGMKNDRNT